MHKLLNMQEFTFAFNVECICDNLLIKLLRHGRARAKHATIYVCKCSIQFILQVQSSGN